MNDNYYKQLVQDSPIGYSYHRIICDEEGIPRGYEFIDGNIVFEKLTGLIGSDILNRSVPEILPETRWSEFNWVKLYVDIEINKDKKEFEQFSKPLNKWYRVIVYSPKKNYLITQYIDISTEKGQLYELKYLEEEKANRAAELVIANEELVFQDEEKANRAAELVIANKELVFQDEEKANRAAELVVANKELVFQDEEKANRAAELVIANTELAYQNEEKDRRAAELVIANKELAYQNEEKDRRAAELVIANKELAYQNKEKEKRAAELITAIADLEKEISERRKASIEIKKLNDELEVKISERTYQLKEINERLEETNATLEEEILEHQTTESELLKAKGAAEAANKAKSQFLANMSHEIRTPMNAIMGLTYLLDQSDLDDFQKRYVSKMEGASTALLRIINDILDSSKIEAGKLEIENIKFNIDMVLENVSNLYTMTATNKGIDINFNTAESVPDLLIGDPYRLEQIISNLTTNAIKFTNQGEVNIAVRCLDETVNSVKLHISVTDTGIGLTKEQIKILFTAFTQADDSMTRKYGGTGLGLTISKQLVELMGGEIWVESAYGEGASFQFTVQFDKAVDSVKLSYEERSYFQEKRVLVIDHNKTSLMILERMLRSFSFEVTTLRNPFEAIELLQREDFDLLVIDFNLPELSGINLYKRLVANTEITVPKTIFVSATGRESYYNQVNQLGVKNFLVKPINQSLMFDAVMNALKGTAWSQANKELNEEKRKKYLEALTDKRILLVEDNDINQLVAKEILEQVGIHVSIASNGEEAIKYVHANKFDAVLMDVQMPIMDGYEATKIIRKTYSGAELPIIAMTANALKGDRERSIKHGMNDYISKPINPERLFETLAKWLSGISIKTIEKSVSEKAEILDFEKTLIRLGNKQDFYYDLLKKYSDKYSNFVKELSEMRQNRQNDEAKRFIHNIKSVTGNIGAIKLSRFIIQFEDHYESYNEKSLCEKLEELSNLNEELLSTIKKIIPITHPEEKLLNYKANFNLYEALSKLRDALAKARAYEIKESLSYLVSNDQDMRFIEQINETKKLINSYRYKDAMVKVEEIMDIIISKGVI